MSLLDYKARLSSLRRKPHGGGKQKPHKVALMLAVIDLIKDGKVQENQIYFDDRLKTAFKKRFEELAEKGDSNRPHTPFFHLHTDNFWHHEVKPGRRRTYENLKKANKAGGPGDIVQNIQYAYFDDELFECLCDESARTLLEAALLRSLGERDIESILDAGEQWNWYECDVVVGEYFAMLTKDAAGKKLDIDRHHQFLSKKLPNRDQASIVEKLRNISAVLAEMGQPCIPHYQPIHDYPQVLGAVVCGQLATRAEVFERAVKNFAEADIPDWKSADWSQVLDTEIPERLAGVTPPKREYLARQVNFSAMERNKQLLGENGEEFVLEFEQQRMERAGRKDLVDEVEWSSKERGDGCGYDIRSFDPKKDSQLFIEVKTTKGGKYQPFFMSANEVDFSRENADEYALYRVFDFRKKPRLFQLPGAVDQHVNLITDNYKATFSDTSDGA